MDAHAAVRGPLRSSSHLPALLAYAIITVALTWPLVLSPGDLVPEDLGDPLLTASVLWWNARQLPFTDAWWNGSFFFPGTENLALSDHRVGLGLFASPLIWFGASPLAAYGITFLLTWWLSAAAAYALVWTVTASRAAGFIGGLIFGFNPFRAGHLAHLELLAAYCLPVILADGAAAAVEAALDDAERIPVTVRFKPRRAAHLRVRQTGRSDAHWAVAELRVLVRPVE